MKDNNKTIYDSTSKLNISSNDSANVNIKAYIQDVKKWSAETPYLYNLQIILKNKKGEVIESISKMVGFRNIQISNAQLLVNGQPIIIKGVNRHEHDYETGHVVSRKSMIQDIEIMKSNNIDEFDINNGKLIYTKSKSKAPLSKKHLLNSLNDFYKNDVEMADQLTKFIMDSRLEVTKEQIKHKD